MHDTYVRCSRHALTQASVSPYCRAWTVRRSAADTNIALTATESLFWGVSDAIYTKRREANHELAYSALVRHLLLEILRLCADAWPRNAWATFPLLDTLPARALECTHGSIIARQRHSRRRIKGGRKTINWSNVEDHTPVLVRHGMGNLGHAHPRRWQL